MATVMETLTNEIKELIKDINDTLYSIQADVNNIKYTVQESERIKTQPQGYQIPQGYVNWSDDHEALKLHLYVPLKEFSSAFQNLLEHLINPTSEAKNIFKEFKTINWETTFEVAERNRFPLDGIYVNVNLPTIKHHTGNIIDAIDVYSKQSRLSSYNDHIKTCITDLLVLVEKDIDDHARYIHNIVSFEEKYKLKWV